MLKLDRTSPLALTRIPYRYPRRRLTGLGLFWLLLAIACFPEMPYFLGTSLWQLGTVFTQILLWYLFLLCLSIATLSLAKALSPGSWVRLNSRGLSAPQTPRGRPVKVLFRDLYRWELRGRNRPWYRREIELIHRDGTLRLPGAWLPAPEALDALVRHIEQHARPQTPRQRALAIRARYTHLTRGLFEDTGRMIEQIEARRASRPLNELELRYLEQLHAEQREHQARLEGQFESVQPGTCA